MAAWVGNAMMGDMQELPPSPTRHGRHETPGSRSKRRLAVSWLLGVSWAAGCIVAFFIGFGLTGVGESHQRPLNSAQEPGFGAALVGLSAAILVLVIGAKISVRRELGRVPDPTAWLRGEATGRCKRSAATPASF
jgi:hypothetical protein